MSNKIKEYNNMKGRKMAFFVYDEAVNAIQLSQFHWVALMKVCIKYEIVYGLVEVENAGGKLHYIETH